MALNLPVTVKITAEAHNRVLFLRLLGFQADTKI